MLPNQRHLFDIPEHVAYFNCAYMSPLLIEAQRAGERAVLSKTRPWKTTPQDFFTRSETCRVLFAELINANPGDIAIVPSASYGLRVASLNLPVAADQTIIVLEDQFPSNVYTWRAVSAANGAEVKTVARPQAAPGSNQDTSWTPAILDAIDDKTTVIALPHCHWADGGIIDLVAVRKAADRHGAALVLDITQSGGALPIDVKRVEPDFLVCACYKWLLGPYALGFLYVNPKWHNGRPLEENWIARQGSEDFTRLIDYQDEYQPDARRFDMGERSSFQLMPIAEAALRQLLKWNVVAIQETLAQFTDDIAQRASQIGFTSLPLGQRAGHFLSLTAPGGLPAKLAGDLADNNIFVSLRGASLRVTPHLFNNDHDSERLLDGLEKLM